MKSRKSLFVVTLLVLSILLGSMVSLAKETVNLRFLVMGLDENKRPIYEEIVRDFEALYPDVKVKLEGVSWDEARQRLVVWIAANQAPDIAMLGWLGDFAAMGVLEPLDKYMTDEMRQNYAQAALDYSTYNGALYSLPWVVSARQLYYRTDWFEEAGIKSPPTTWEELLEVAAKIHQPPQRFAYGLVGKKHPSFVTQWLSILYQAGGRLFDGNKPVFNSPEAVTALEYYVQLAKYSQPDPVAYSRPEAENAFVAGKIGMMESGPWLGQRLDEAGIPYGVTQNPGKVKNTAVVLANALAIFKQSKHKDWAWKFLEHAQQDKYYDKINLAHGMVPIKKTVASLPHYSKSPFWSAFTEALELGTAGEDTNPLFGKAQDPLGDAIQKVLLGKATAKEALDHAVKLVR